MNVYMPMKLAMRAHEEKCDSSGLILKIIKKQESIPNPSYSMIHILEDGFSIMMYSCTHDTKNFNGCVHRKYAIMLTLNKAMKLIWNESLYHSRAKSRQTPSGLVKADLKLFMYLWPFIENNQQNRNISTTDGVAREYGEFFYRDKLDKHMCKGFYDD